LEGNFVPSLEISFVHFNVGLANKIVAASRVHYPILNELENVASFSVITQRGRWRRGINSRSFKGTTVGFWRSIFG
jgi:hypothetical protein